MGFRYRRRPKVHWVSGQFQDAVTTGIGAGVQTNISLVGGADIADLGYAGELYVRRCVGVMQALPGTSGSHICRMGLAVSPVVSTVVQYFDLDNTVDFEDGRWVWRRDYSTLGYSPAVPTPAEFKEFWRVDWKGNVKLKEGTNEFVASVEIDQVYSYFINLRCLVQSPRQ